MFTIGEMARICGVSTKTLRLYEAEGLLAPARVDAHNQYRYYSPDQVLPLRRILFLRELGLPLEAIRRLVRVLSQYRSQVRGESTPPSPSVSPVEPPPVAPSPVAQAAPPPVVSPAPKIDDDPVLADLDSPHTLGPSTVGSSDEIDAIQSEAPRTLGRSRAYDDDEDVSAS